MGKRVEARQTAGSNCAVASPRYLTMGINDGKGVMFVSHTGLIHEGPSGAQQPVRGKQRTRLVWSNRKKQRRARAISLLLLGRPNANPAKVRLLAFQHNPWERGMPQSLPLGV